MPAIAEGGALAYDIRFAAGGYAPSDSNCGGFVYHAF
jgi:hypothetical protein